MGMVIVSRARLGELAGVLDVNSCAADTAGRLCHAPI